PRGPPRPRRRPALPSDRGRARDLGGAAPRPRHQGPHRRRAPHPHPPPPARRLRLPRRLPRPAHPREAEDVSRLPRRARARRSALRTSEVTVLASAVHISSQRISKPSFLRPPQRLSLPHPTWSQLDSAERAALSTRLGA